MDNEKNNGNNTEGDDGQEEETEGDDTDGDYGDYGDEGDESEADEGDDTEGEDDGDGDDDILVSPNATSTHPNTVYTFLRTGEADLAQCDTYPTPPGVDTLQRPMLGDFDGDLVPDLLAIDLHDETKSPNTPEFYRSVNDVLHGIP